MCARFCEQGPTHKARRTRPFPQRIIGDSRWEARPNTGRASLKYLGFLSGAYRLRSCGSKRTRIQSPNRLALSTRRAMQMPGNTASHQLPLNRASWPC